MYGGFTTVSTISRGPCAPDERHERGGAHPETVICLACWARMHRDYRNLTRLQAAKATGISTHYVKGIENNGLIPRPDYLESLITGYRMDAAQARLTWDLWRPPARLPPVQELRQRISTPHRRELLTRLDSAGVAIAYLDPLWNILTANNTFFRVLPGAGVSTDGNLALWSLPPRPQPSPAKPLLAHPGRDAQWLVGVLRGGFGRYRTSPEVHHLHRQLSRNDAFNHHWRTSLHVAYGRDLQEPLHLHSPATHRPYTLDLQVTEIADVPEVHGFVAWPPPTPGHR